MEPELGRVDHAEVAAAAAQPPEQLGVLVVAGADDLARRGDQLRGDQVVAGEPVLGGEVADAAAEGEAGDPGGADHAAGRDEAVRLGRGVEVEPGGAALGARDPRLRIDLDRPASARGRSPARRRPRSARRGCGRRPGRRPPDRCAWREGEGRRHVVGVDTARDHRRPAVDQQVEAAARPLVLAVGRLENVALQRFLQLFHVEKDRVNLANSSPRHRISAGLVHTLTSVR